MKCAVTTMVYNEPVYLPLWCKYYGSIFGPENCFIIDHGSDDGSTQGLAGFNVISIPRSPKDNDKRTRYVSSFCSNLLEWYDAIIYSDVDEIIVAEPSKYTDLLSYVASRPTEIVAAFGFEIYHDMMTEPAISLAGPIFAQRQWIRFSSAMCKPVLSYRPIQWSPGFHTADCEVGFGEIYLFHLRYFDLELGLERLRRTRAMPWASPSAGSHQRMPDDDFTELMRRIARQPKIFGCDLLPENDPLRGYIERVRASERDFRVHRYSIDLHIVGDLVEIPLRFRRAL